MFAPKTVQMRFKKKPIYAREWRVRSQVYMITDNGYLMHGCSQYS